MGVALDEPDGVAVGFGVGVTLGVTVGFGLTFDVGVALGDLLGFPVGVALNENVGVNDANGDAVTVAVAVAVAVVVTVTVGSGGARSASRGSTRGGCDNDADQVERAEVDVRLHLRRSARRLRAGWSPRSRCRPAPPTRTASGREIPVLPGHRPPSRGPLDRAVSRLIAERPCPDTTPIALFGKPDADVELRVDREQHRRCRRTDDLQSTDKPFAVQNGHVLFQTVAANRRRWSPSIRIRSLH